MSESLLIARERDFIEISGPESRSFLQGQLSQDIENLTEGNRYYRIREDGEFILYEVPNLKKIGL